MKNAKITRLCNRLDTLVAKAEESTHRQWKKRDNLMKMADAVRVELRKVDH